MVRLIPTEFSSVNHYLESFRYPLIEEARSVLSTCLFAVSDAPFVGMIVERCNVSEGFTNDGNNIFSFSLYNGERRGHYEPKVGDIVLLSTSVPKDYEEIRQGIRPTCLAVVDLIGNGNGKQCGKLSKFGSEEIKGGGSSYVAIYLMNFTETSHIWTTLNVDTTDPHLNLNLIKKALCRKSLDLESCSCTCTSFQTEDILHEKIVSKLNESQIDAVRFLISPIRCNHSLSMRCISGLPGTGKSEIACIIALAALNLKCRVILCVPAKFSVVDIASHFVKIVNRCHGGYNLKDIVVFGENSEEHYKSTGDLAFIRPDILNMLKHGRRIPNTTEKQCNRLFCLDKSPLIFCSVSRLLSLKGCGSVAVLIMDNADLIKEWESVLPLQLKGLRHVLLMGNDNEFQRTFKSQISEAVGCSRSLFTRVGSLCPPKKLIDIQYRMHHGISCFPSKRLFSGQLLNDPDDISKIRFNCQLPEHIYKAYSFIDFADGKEISNDHGEDWKNIIEAAVVIKILTKLFRARVNSGGKISIGVISPYKAQVQLIQEMISDRIESISEISLWVRSSEEIQSCEVDVIIISTVRCNESGSVGLLSDRYLTSASLTRARHCLWILGNRSTLVKSHSIWKDLVVDAEERGCFFHAGEDKDLAAVILDVKRELDELNDLLNQESVLFNHKKWKMIFSDDFKRSFVALKTLFIKQIVLGFLLKLAGGWRPKRRCFYALSPSLCKYVKLYKVHGLYLVCTTDIATESKFIQVLRIWDVLPLVEIPNVVVKLEKMTYLFSDYYMKRCLEQKYEGNLVVPMSWNICSDFVKYKCAASLPDLENSKVNESLLLMKFYSLSSVSVKNLLKACDGREIELPFEVSDLELEIVKCPRSAFVLGRSGTGKTIISIMKLMKREQEYVEALHGIVPFNWFSYHNKRCENNAVAGYGLRQIFITVSVNLCSGVKDYINRLKRCIFGIEIQAGSSDGEMWELGDSLSMFSDIPDSFTNMPQRHFPIVVSLHKFLLMLDGSLSRSFFNRFKDLKVISDGQRSTMTHAQQQIILGKEVRFERFLTSYWPSFDAKYTRKLDPLLVYTQIISFIKGGCRLGVADQNEKMSEEDYIKLFNSTKSTISEKKRQIIFKLYMDYEKKKGLNGEFDISDLVIDIQHRLRFEGYGGPMMDFVYIDEVQDFTLNQLSLLKYICSNVKEGFVFSGDTAQTISRGVHFRFQDIRSLFYTDFNVGPERSTDFFKLKQNFRTHSSVLNLAQSVLTLLYHFFPESVDKLESETSLVHGELPVLLQSCDQNVLKNIFHSNVGNSNGVITFGAQQVILVRDDCAKVQVIEQVGKNALVLTINECKGLEFQDVLLYNFFEKAPLERWEVVYEFMVHKNLLDARSLKYPPFNKDRHSALCNELKELYVAITRTRQRLWVFESISHPLFDYWKKLGVVKLGELDFSFGSCMPVFCKLEEWNLRGQKFFNEGNYETALFCFKRSGDVYRLKWAQAAFLQMEGENKWHKDIEMAATCLSNAAELYEEIGKFESSAACFLKSGNYEKASKIYLEKFREPRFEDAGHCFDLAGSWSNAATNYAQGKCLSKCLSSCKSGELFELGWAFIKKWSGKVPTDTKVNFLKSWISKINKLSDIVSVVEIARTFPEDANSFLIENENYVEASELQRIRGNTILEAYMLERAEVYEKSSKLVNFHIAVQVISTDERSGWSMQHAHNLKKLLDRAKELAYRVSKSYGDEVWAELAFLSDRNYSLSNIRAHFQRAQNRNITVETFAARKLLEAYLKLDVDQYDDDSDAVFKWRSMDFQKVVFRGHFSAQVLVNIWNTWKQRISCLFSYLQGSVNTSQYKIYKDLCHKYFGVLKLNSKDVFLAFNSQASWLKGANEESLHRIDEKVYISGPVFRFLAQKFLRTEVSFVCDKLLGILTQLQMNYQEKRFCFVQRSVLALQISGIVIFHDKYGSCPRNFGLSEGFLNKAFSPLYYTDSMISSKDTNCQEKSSAVQAVGLVLHENLKSFKDSLMNTGWAIIFLFLSNEVIDELTWEIRHKTELGCPWKRFFVELHAYKDMLLAYKDMGFSSASSLAHSFLHTLLPTDPDPQSQILLHTDPDPQSQILLPTDPDPQSQILLPTDPVPRQILLPTDPQSQILLPTDPDPQSQILLPTDPDPQSQILLPTDPDPQSPILLLECLLFLTSSCQIGRGWFLTSKLIYTQSVDSEKSESYQYALLGSSEQAEVSPFLRHVYDFILAVVWKILSEWRFEWARKYKTKALHFRQLLVLRLVTVLGLVCLNSEEHFSKVQELMRDAAGILPLLPQDFQLKFWFLMKGRIRTSKYFAYLFAKALESVDNQLVLVHKDGCGNAFMFLKPVVVNSSSFQQMNKI